MSSGCTSTTETIIKEMDVDGTLPSTEYVNVPDNAKLGLKYQMLKYY